MNIDCIVQNPSPPQSCNYFTTKAAENIRRYHRGFAHYHPTPLVSLNELSTFLGIKRLFVKDESCRFDLNAFKVLGGSYAIGKYLSELGASYAVGKVLAGQTGLNLETTSPQILKKALKETVPVTFITATDGNHGRAVAWAAAAFGQKSVVYMPKGSAVQRLENIRKEGAVTEITDYNYDDTVRYAAKMAEENGWILLQDTAWEGYETIPRWIMQGYLTMADETHEALKQAEARPTHIFLQAGVGSMAAAVLAYFTDAYIDDPPIFVIMEPDQADCFYQSIKEGTRVEVKTEMNTMMAGLACGLPATLAWDIITPRANAFLSLSDAVAALGMRLLNAPYRNDTRIISGESGAVGAGLAYSLYQDDEYREIKQQLQLDAHSQILLFSTEGITDDDNYRHVLWGV